MSQAEQIDLNSSVQPYVRQPAITLRRDQTVGEAIAALRDASLKEREPDEDILYFYVVDSNNKLIGVLPVRRLLLNPSVSRIGDIMLTDIISIPSTATLLEVSGRLLETRLLALPIVDSEGRLLGIIDITMFTDETPNLVRQREIDNVFQLIGVHVGLGRNISSWRSFRDRFPWLLSNIGAGIICAFIAGMYESLISFVTLLALFIPVVLTLAESVSMQSMTLTLQTASGYSHSWRILFRAVKREFLAALFLGLGSGFMVGIIAYVWKEQLLAAVAIATSITLAMIVACLFGVLIPGAVKAFRKDPNIASGPIVLALADIATIIFFFSMAGWLLGN